MLVVQVFMESRNSWEAKGSGGQIELAIEKAAMTASCGMLSATAEAKTRQERWWGTSEYTKSSTSPGQD